MPVAKPIAELDMPSSLRSAGMAMAMLVRSMNDSTYITNATPRIRAQRLRCGAKPVSATTSLPRFHLYCARLSVRPRQLQRNWASGQTLHSDSSMNRALLAIALLFSGLLAGADIDRAV